MYTKNKTNDIHIRVSDAFLKWLDGYADRAGLTRSEAVRRCLEEYMFSCQIADEVISRASDFARPSGRSVHRR